MRLESYSFLFTIYKVQAINILSVEELLLGKRAERCEISPVFTRISNDQYA